MNTPPPPAVDTSPAGILKIRRFLARLLETPLLSIKVTGDPATDENTDLLESYTVTRDSVEIVKLCACSAIHIDNILAGDIDRLPDETPDLAKGAEMFGQFVAHPVKLYP